MKKILSFIMVMVVCILGIQEFDAASSEFVPVSNFDFNTVETFSTLTDSYSPMGVVKGTIETSDLFELNEDGDNVIIGAGEDIVGQSIRYNDVEFGSTVAADIEITITGAEEYPDFSDVTTGAAESIKFTNNFWLSTNGYRHVYYRVDFFQPGTDIPENVNVMYVPTDIDYDQIIAAQGDESSIVVTADSWLQGKQDGDIFSFTNHGVADNEDQSGALFYYDEVSSIDMMFAMNKDLPEINPMRAGGSVQLDFRMAVNFGKIDVNKVDQDGNPLEKTSFGIYNEDETLVETITTDENGYAQSHNLPLGTYTVHEDTPTEGYIGDDTIYNVTIENTGDLVHVNDGTAIVNNQIMGNIDLNKVDQNNNPLAGTEFTIYDAAGNEVDTLTTDSSGYAISKDLPYGDYTVVETKATTNYELDDTVYSVSITTDGETVHVNDNNPIVNQLGSGNIDLNKQDDKGNPLAGAEFTIYDVDGNEIETIVTDSSGYAKSSDLVIGDYTVVETAAPANYVLDSTVYPASITTIDQTVSINDGNPIINLPYQGQITLTKVNADGNPLAGTEFTIYDADGNKVETMVTDAEGKATSSKLDFGDYNVVETKASTGYVLDSTEYPATIDTDGQVVELNSGNPIVNQLGNGQIQVYKIDEDENPLAGAEFTIYDADGAEAEVITTDETGYGLSGQLPVGTYSVIETAAPDGYILSDTKYTVKIVEDGQVAKVNNGEGIVNKKQQLPNIDLPTIDPAKGQVELNKVDPDGNELAGAEFTIYNAKNHEVETIVTDQDGYAISKDLKYGDYTITETKAPEGYLINPTVFNFTIDQRYEIETINEGNAVIDEIDTTDEVSEVTSDEVVSETSETDEVVSEASKTDEVVSEASKTDNVDTTVDNVGSEAKEKSTKELAHTGSTSSILLVLVASLFTLGLYKLQINKK